jgi:inorganic pyrophosphatase
MKRRTALKAFRRDGSINAVVESPRGSAIKVKYDPAEGVMTLSRPLPAGLLYPFDWGFIPGTRAADGDPLDAFILWDATSYPGIVIPCRAIGILQVEQTSVTSNRRPRNDRVAVVPLKAPRQESLKSIFDVPEQVRAEFELLFLRSVAFEGKHPTVLGWKGPDSALTTSRAAWRAIGCGPSESISWAGTECSHDR